MHRAVPKMQAKNGSINGKTKCNETFNYSKLTSKIFGKDSLVSLEPLPACQSHLMTKVRKPENLTIAGWIDRVIRYFLKVSLFHLVSFWL